MNLIEKLSFLMERDGIKNPSQLAKATSIPYTTLKSIFDGHVNDVTLTTAKKLRDFFKITLDELLDDNIPFENKKNELETDGLTNEDIEDIKEFIRFKKERRKKN